MKTFKQLQERLGGKGYKPYTSLIGKKISGDWEDSDRGAGNKAKRRAGEKVKAKSPTYLAHVHNKKLKEHHQTDANGKVIEHGDGTPSSVEEDYYKGTGEKVQARTKKWMDKKGQKGAPGLDAMKARTAEHKAKRGVKEEADAYKYVVSKLKKKYGSGVLTKGDKIKPQSAADKAKVRAHQAKVDAENAAERAKDPSQGRYPKGYSNRGSD